MHIQETTIHGLRLRFVQPQSAEEVTQLWPAVLDMSANFSPPLTDSFYQWLCQYPTMLMLVETEGLYTSWVVQDVTNSPTLAEIQGCTRANVQDYFLEHRPQFKPQYPSRLDIRRLSREIDLAVTLNMLDNIFIHHHKEIAYIRCAPDNKYARGFAITWGFQKVGLSPKDNNLVYQLTRAQYEAKKVQIVGLIQNTRLVHPSV